MDNPIKIAIDAMGGDNSPEKVIKGIEIHSSVSKNIFYNIFESYLDIVIIVYVFLCFFMFFWGAFYLFL